MGVVAVMMSVDQGADGPVGNLADGLQEGAGAALGEAGVHHRDRAVASDEAGIVQPPAAVQLDVGIHAGADLFHRGGRQLVGAVGMARAGIPRHGRPPGGSLDTEQSSAYGPAGMRSTTIRPNPGPFHSRKMPLPPAGPWRACRTRARVGTPPYRKPSLMPRIPPHPSPHPQRKGRTKRPCRNDQDNYKVGRGGL